MYQNHSTKHNLILAYSVIANENVTEEEFLVLPMKVDFALAVAGSTTGQTHVGMNSKLTCAGSFMVCMANNLQ